MSTHPNFWKFLEELFDNVIEPAETMVEQINAGNNPREPLRRARAQRAERQNAFEAKLTNREWTPTR